MLSYWIFNPLRTIQTTANEPVLVSLHSWADFPNVFRHQYIANEATVLRVVGAFHGYLNNSIKHYRNLWNAEGRFAFLPSFSTGLE